MTRPIRPETDRLLLDVMLGKIAVYLRICGFDAAYALDRGVEADDAIAALASREDRLLLTRDRVLAAAVDGSVCLSARELEEQLTELRDAGVELTVASEPARCGRCNGLLRGIEPNSETPAYAPDPADTDCWRCMSCEQIFWKGSHYERMRAKLTDR